MKNKVRPMVLLGSFLLAAPMSFAGSATWRPHPTSSDWNNAANWRPRTIPNGAADIATFGVSDITNVTLPVTPIEVDSVIFNPGAGAFTFTTTYPGSLVFSGAGIINHSGVTQTFVTGSYYPEGISFHNQANAGVQAVITNAAPYSRKMAFYDESSAGSATLTIFGNDEFMDATPELDFHNNATADRSTIITTGGSGDHGEGAATVFWDTSTAANATIMVTAATHSYAYWGGILDFIDKSTAADSVITIEGSSLSADGGFTSFQDDATAANATITVNGAGSSDGVPGIVGLYHSSSAENATLIANPGSNGGAGGTIEFGDTPDGGRVRIELFGNSLLDLSDLTEDSLSIGSLEGDGTAFVGTHTLTIGTNNLSTEFSGLIEGGGTTLGTVIKVGSGTLTLSGANTYGGYTVVNGGFLRVENGTGSATGLGSVTVSSGTIGGGGFIGGSVKLATLGVLAPGSGATTLTVKKTLSFEGGNYTWRVKTTTPSADKVSARGVTLASASFTGIAVGNAVLSPGTAFTAIDNTSRSPISGTFGNLPDGGTIKIGNNTFQANYQGGDGNDLTLSVVP